MQFDVTVDTAEATEQETAALLDWLRHERVPGLAAQPVHAPPAPGEMGPGLPEGLSLFAGLAQLGGLITAIGGFLSARRSEARIRLKSGDCEVEIDGKNIGDIDEVIDRAYRVFERCVE